jgi:hypothetical protein
MASNTPCSLNSGNGDGGSQVKSLDNKCWLAQFPDTSRIDIRWFGAKPFTGTGVPAPADDVAPFIRAAYLANAGRLYVPGSGGVWPLLTQVLADGKPFKLIGDYPNEPQGTHACPTGKPSGTWFRIAATAGQFFLNGDAAGIQIQGSSLEGFGVCQDHLTALGPSWSPTIYPPVFKISSVAGSFINRIYWYGVYDAFAVQNSARATINEQRGQVFHYFWVGDHLLDLTQWNNWHLWTFWSENDPNVFAWQTANGEVARLGRTDGIQGTNIFALGYKEVIHFVKSGPTDAGPTSGFTLSALYCDAVKYCIHSDVDAGNVQASFGFVQAGGENVVNSVPVNIEAGSNNISIANAYFLDCYGPCVQNIGPNGIVAIGYAFASNYDTQNVGYNAFRANSTNPAFPSYIALGQLPIFSFPKSPSTTASIDNTTADGYVAVSGIVTRDYTPVLSFGGGTTGIAYASNTGRVLKNLYTGEVHGTVGITLTSKGSSTGTVSVSIPGWLNSLLAADRSVGTPVSTQIGTNLFYNTLPSVQAPMVIIGTAPGQIGIQLQNNNNAGPLTDANFTNTSSISFSW